MQRGDYTKLAEEAKKQKRVTDITIVFEKMRDVGQKIVGQLIGLQRIRSRSSGGQYLQYLIETDAGTRKISFGAAYDREMIPVLHINNVYEWEYLGKKDLAGGNAINQVKTNLIDESEAGELAINYVERNCPTL